MNHKSQLFKECQYFIYSISLNIKQIIFWILIYSFFIYRYILLSQASLCGNIVTFLHINGTHTLTDVLIINITSIIFYLFPLLLIGNQWAMFMKTSNLLIKIRQHFSSQHFWIGELLWIIIGSVWYIINSYLYDQLSLSFAKGNQFFYFILIFTIVSNLFLLFSCWNANSIGWIIVIISISLFTISSPSYIISILILMILLLENIYLIKYYEVT